MYLERIYGKKKNSNLSKLPTKQPNFLYIGVIVHIQCGTVPRRMRFALSGKPGTNLKANSII